MFYSSSVIAPAIAILRIQVSHERVEGERLLQGSMIAFGKALREIVAGAALGDRRQGPLGKEAIAPVYQRVQLPERVAVEVLFMLAVDETGFSQKDAAQGGV